MHADHPWYRLHIVSTICSIIDGRLSSFWINILSITEFLLENQQRSISFFVFVGILTDPERWREIRESATLARFWSFWRWWSYACLLLKNLRSVNLRICHSRLFLELVFAAEESTSTTSFFPSSWFGRLPQTRVLMYRSVNFQNCVSPLCHLASR